jgi:peptidoglycan/LPS O-acetylase OafA/YrhL
MINKRLKIFLTAVAILLLIPFIAMQFTDEVSWTIFDFIVMGILLLSTSILCELTIRKVTKIKHRIAICIVIIAAFLIIWAELAVGIFGTPFAGS